MSRSGYSDGDGDVLELGRWRAQVASSIRGKRGQSFLRELVDALDAMPEKRLITNTLEESGNFCAIGSVGLRRGTDMAKLDPEDPYTIANAFGITHQLVQEIEYENDEIGWNWKDQRPETPEERWSRMRKWAVSNLREQQS